jgi:L-lactate dehydrogenase (cytochrome)/(S)-mandelate dehydrogenase
MRPNIAKAFNTEDFRRIAKRRLPKGLFEFVDRGAEDELTLRANRAAFERIPLFHRALVDVSARNMDVSLFGRKFKAPIAVAPTGAAGLLWFEGEIAMARAAAKLAIPFTISTASITPLEAVAKASDGELWFQLYVWPDLDMTFQLVDRARNAGYRALVVTVDSAVPSNREYNKRNGFTIPIRYTARNVTDALLHPSWLVGVYGRQILANGVPTFANFPSQLQTDLRGSVRKSGSMVPKNETVTWDLLRRLRDRWDGPLMVKGILHPDDARLAEQCGADAVIVSNHGGRNLDGAAATLDALPAIVDAVGGRMTVMLDSGVRRGADVVKALALGAQAVLVGRVPLWGTAAGGEAGAHRALTLLVQETDRVMAYLGCTSLADIARLPPMWPTAPVTAREYSLV